jgi:hypothetical protein
MRLPGRNKFEAELVGQILARLAIAWMEVYLHQAAIHLRVATAQAPAAEERTDRYLGRLFVLLPFPFDAPLQTSAHPAADAIGNTLAQPGPRMNHRGRQAVFTRVALL